MPYNSDSLFLFPVFLCWWFLLISRSLAFLCVAVSEQNLGVFSCSLSSVSGICLQETVGLRPCVSTHSQVCYRIFSTFSLLRKFSRPPEGLHFVQVAFFDEETKCIAKTADSVRFCERTHSSSFVLNAFLIF